MANMLVKMHLKKNKPTHTQSNTNDLNTFYMNVEYCAYSIHMKIMKNMKKMK